MGSNRFSFRDDFNFQTVSQLQAAGWSLCGGGAPSSYTTVGNGVVNLTNDGHVGANVCYTNIPPRVSSWTVSANGSWIGNAYGSIEVIVQTGGHVYRWDADGYYHQFILLRDDVIVSAINGYTPQLYSWHVLRLDGNPRTGLSMFFDGQKIGSFQDVKGTSYTMTQLILIAGWTSSESWDWITAAAT